MFSSFFKFGADSFEVGGGFFVEGLGGLELKAGEFFVAVFDQESREAAAGVRRGEGGFHGHGGTDGFAEETDGFAAVALGSGEFGAGREDHILEAGGGSEVGVISNLRECGAGFVEAAGTRGGGDEGAESAAPADDAGVVILGEAARDDIQSGGGFSLAEVDEADLELGRPAGFEGLGEGGAGGGVVALGE